MLNTSPVIEARKLSKEFGHHLVLDQVELSVVAGEVVALMGGNGCGKTTLLRCLASELRPSSGEVLWFGRRAGADPNLRRTVGVVGHESYLYPNLTVYENLLFAARMCDVADARKRVAELIALMGLQPHAGRLTVEVSRGTRQRLAIGRALVHEPRILLLDEPFSGLDRDGRNWLSRLLQESRDCGRAICFSTHEEAKALQLANRAVLLHAGHLQSLEMVRDRICA